MNKNNLPFFDVAIVGGGMVGLSLARMLSMAVPEAGVAILDSHSLAQGEPLYQPSFDARSTAVSSQSIELFGAMGVWEGIRKHVTEIRCVHVSDSGHPGTTAYSQQQNKHRTLGCVVENAWLGQQLAAAVRACPGVKVVTPATARDIFFHPAGARLEVEYEGQCSPVNCQLVVLADGTSSVLRKKLGITVDVFDYHQVAVIANLAFEKSHRGVAYERFTESGPLALLPRGESSEATDAAMVWTRPQAQLEQIAAWDSEEFLSRFQKVFGYRLGKFLRISERHTYPLQRQLAREQVRSSLVLMGNAAHYLHPVAGQGFNLALRDCACLVEILKAQFYQGKALGDLAALQGYVNKQENDQWLTTMLSHNLNRVFTDASPLSRFMRNAGLLSLNLLPPVKNAFFGQMMGKGLYSL